MNKETHDKEWIEVERKKSVIWSNNDGTAEDNIFFNRKDVPNFNANIPKSLLDQIRRDANKELLDEFNKIMPVIEHPNWIIVDKGYIKFLRAKTLSTNEKSAELGGQK